MQTARNGIALCDRFLESVKRAPYGGIRAPKIAPRIKTCRSKYEQVLARTASDPQSGLEYESTLELPISVVELIRKGAVQKIAAINELRSIRPGLGLAEAKKIVEEAGVKLGTMSATKSGCFVATACYGNYDHPVVVELRHFRDDCLEASTAGRAFVGWYYKWSPAFARLVANNGVLKALARFLIVGPALAVARVINKHQ
jgi:hypothetical protein